MGEKRATVHDVAAKAGVSLATVDRVLNGRPGVRPQTAEKVEKAIAALDFRRDLSASLLARARDLNVHFLLPGGDNAFMALLAEAVERRAAEARGERLRLTVSFPHALDASALAQAIDGLDPAQTDCAVIVAIEAPQVVAAVDAAHRRGITVLTLVSDLPGSARRQFIGIDNIAAGRTAAALLGRFCPNGKIGLVAGSLGLRDHRERLEGFAAVARAEFPALVLLPPVEGHDDDARTAACLAGMLDAHPDLRGLYAVGAGTGGLVAALADKGRAGTVRVVAHELVAPTRAGLASGAVDVVLDQDPAGEIAAAIAAARVLAAGGDPGQVPIAIGIFLRDNLR